MAFLFFNISAVMGASLAHWNKQMTTCCTAESGRPAACMSSPLSFLSVFTLPIKNKKAQKI